MWSSQLALMLAAAGAAVGLGNVWRFPYLVGMNGGAAFVIVYVVLALFIGYPVMLAELSVGRAAKQSTVSAFYVVSKNPLFRLIGWLGMLCGGFVILSYYGVVGGWTIKYMVLSLGNLMEQAAGGQSEALFNTFIATPYQQVLYQVLFMGATAFIVLGGVGKGIERACKLMMPSLFVILLILIVRAVTLPGAAAGLDFYLRPDFSKINAASVLAALGQGFFSLSLGMGITVTYGSYISERERLPVCAAGIVAVDTAIALLSGLAIFPAVFAMGLEPTAGPGLTFVALPTVFAKMPAGAFFSFIFFLFLFLFFAAVTSSMSLLEVAVSYGIDSLKMSRRKACAIMVTLITLLGIPSAVSLSGAPMVGGKAFFDAMNYLSDSIMMPLASVLLCIFAGWFWVDRARLEVSNGGSYRFGLMGVWIFCLRILAPIAIFAIFIKGLKW